MGNLGPVELLVIALIALLLFGAGRISDIGKGLGQGISNFKKGLRESEEDDVKKLPPKGGTARDLEAKKEVHET
jgi:sec-independent protein translocase protein TatA